MLNETCLHSVYENALKEFYEFRYKAQTSGAKNFCARKYHLCFVMQAHLGNFIAVGIRAIGALR
jgi:hypothetical protein